MEILPKIGLYLVTIISRTNPKLRKYLDSMVITKVELWPQLVFSLRPYYFLLVKDNAHSHLHHTKQPMAVRGDGGLSNARFPLTKWDFCSEVKKLH